MPAGKRQRVEVLDVSRFFAQDQLPVLPECDPVVAGDIPPVVQIADELGEESISYETRK